MENKKPNSASKNSGEENEKKFPGYPEYPGSENIYSNEKKLGDPDPDDYPGINNRAEDNDGMNEKDFDDDVVGDDLDIPGADLDDDMEDIGSEDEENNYYSLGGDDHDDLEEDRGDQYE